MLGINHFTVHEADVAVYHAWRDGWKISGPFDRHLELAMVARFRAGLSISRQPQVDGVPSFGDWRLPGKAGDVWTLEFSGALGALTDGEVPMDSFAPAGTPLVVVVRFRCSETKQWRVFQFHNAELDQPDAKEASENMMVDYRFRAGWMEDFKGRGDASLPTMQPRMVGVVEWVHLGRRIPCWYYDPETDAWEETAENLFLAGEEERRYVRIEDNEGVRSLSYMAATTQASTTAGGLDSATIGWIDAPVFEVADSGGVQFQPGWSFQPGAPEPIWIPQSGRHWDHPQVRFRFLGRIYATIAHGVFATPAYVEDAPQYPIDLPIRMGRLVVLPEASYLLPEA